ncbi:unnamed protein product [Onchocerca ochengi]|uniref:Helitron_like_N domain-containing protein n=1 Tax=Onchocerca ochengi TaxID=42157 RepID=A0A182DYQ4_ONCOC|nr:unnamed protein product [Onchocerca ochengi]
MYGWEHGDRVLQLQICFFLNRMNPQPACSHRYYDEVCPDCKALEFNGETKRMCCAAGKIKLPQLGESAEPLKTVLAGYTAESKHFLSNIRKYTSYFQKIERVRRFNAPSIDEVAIVIVGDQLQPRDIILHRRNDQLTKIAETDRCYDALQYSIIFWDGSTCHMHEYAQDVIAYVRHYGRPDQFLTFTCSPAWDDIQNLLLPGQSPVDRHDITASVFRQKLKSLMDFMVKHEVFGSVCCWIYLVE